MCVLFREFAIVGHRSQRSKGIISFFGSTFNVYETSVLDHSKL